ncbi:hypothetical protein BGX34_006709 [Mortierella sp. NVP85]|nr:hypothetical protein BGX34_006709 [Mortierella sp. NVP85]
MALTLVSSNKHFGGMLNKYSHQSSTTQCVMVFNIFLPKESVSNKVPVLYCLGGLTSTEDNFAIKSGFGQRASQYGLALVFPDTSPRDVDVPEAGANPDIGYSAGFYLNATQHPWDKNWKMYDYITQELPQVLAENLPVSVSAFAPITHPTQSAWGKFAFPKYLGEDPQAWDEYDTINLLQRYKEQNKFRSDVKVLIDQGTGDGFLDPDRLHTSELIKVVDQLGLKDQFEIRYQDGYNHGYFFISTFINDHIDHHAKVLGLTLP